MAKIHAINYGELKEIASCLCGTVTSGYGPSFQHTIFSTSTGKILITNNGIEILKSFDIRHPVARYLVNAIADHHKLTGEDSKTFIVLLNELLIKSERVATDWDGMLKLSHDFVFVLNEILPSLFVAMDRFCVRLNISMLSSCVEKGVKSLVLGTVNSHLLEYDAAHVADVFVKFLQRNVANNVSSSMNSVTGKLYDNHKLLIIENPGRALSTSFILPGFLLSRGFCNLSNTTVDSFEEYPIKFALLSCAFDSVCDDYQNVELLFPDEKDEDSINRIIEHKKLRTDKFLNYMKKLGVSLVISSVQLSTLEKSECLKHGMTVIHALPTDELEFLSVTFDMGIMSDCSEVVSTGELQKCEQIVFGSQVYTNLVPASPIQSSSLIIAGPTEAISHQVKSLIVSSLKVIRSSLTSQEFSHQLSSAGVSMDNVSTCSSVYKSSRNSEGGDSGICLTMSEQCDESQQLSPLSSSSNSQHCKHGYAHEEAISDYLHMIPVGGAFELALHQVINNYLSTQPAAARGSTALTILKEALLSVPQLLHTNAYYIAKPRWLQTLATAKDAVKCGRVIGIDATEGMATKSILMHSFSNKCLLIVNVLTTFRQLLHLDHII